MCAECVVKCGMVIKSNDGVMGELSEQDGGVLRITGAQH